MFAGPVRAERISQALTIQITISANISVKEFPALLIYTVHSIYRPVLYSYIARRKDATYVRS